MATINTNFKRVEKKYLITKDQYEGFRKSIDTYMKEDEYGLSSICNIYYDTRDYDLIRHSIEKPVYKEKLRLRSYGTPTSEDNVFLEIKKKYAGVVYKRRVVMKLQDAYKGIEEKHLNVDGQIAHEIEYFLNRYELEPKVFLAYDRIAMFGVEDSALRMTFDFNIRSRSENIDLAAGDYGELLLPDGEIMLEIKVANSYPFWLIQALEENGIYPVSFSKYGNVYKKHLLPEYLAEYKLAN